MRMIELPTPANDSYPNAFLAAIEKLQKVKAREEKSHMDKRDVRALHEAQNLAFHAYREPENGGFVDASITQINRAQENMRENLNDLMRFDGESPAPITTEAQKKLQEHEKACRKVEKVKTLLEESHPEGSA